MSHRSGHRMQPPRPIPHGGATAGRTGRLRPVVWVGVGVAMLVWSLLAWLLYQFTDPVLAWLAVALDVVVDQGQGAAKVFGNRPAGEILAAIDANTLPGQLLPMLKGAGKSIVVAIWIVGMLALAALPIGLSWVGRIYYRGRY